MFFILIASIITCLIASGMCYVDNYNGKGAFFLAIGVILIIGTYQYYESKRRQRKINNGYNSTNYDACGYWDCCQFGHIPTSADCSSFDCGGVDCSGGDCNSG